ncbi:uncharacterized protein LOC142324096 [Lycorma delicatula]|uniref:uncharacterized protein LOC142324096 n=1 Tax=Lycorma delicatula TaxID=130591 RepID=UPI003F5151A3
MSGDIDLYNINEVCRLCLKCDGTILPIFGLEHSSRDCIPLSSKIKACVSVEVNKNDDLPKKICVGCVHQVDSWHKFKTICDNSQNKLRTWFKSTQPNSRGGQHQMQGEVKQEYVDIDDNEVICCDEELNGFNNTAATSSNQNVIIVDDDDDEDDDDDDDMMIDDDNDNNDDVDIDNSDNNVIGGSDQINNENDHGDVNQRCGKGYTNGMVVDKSSITPNDGSEIVKTGNIQSVNKSLNDTNSSPDILIESVSSHSQLKTAGDKNLSPIDNLISSKNNSDDSGFISDERMLADFRDELAPDVELSVNDDSHLQTSDVPNDKENQIEPVRNDNNITDIDGESCFKLLKDRSSNIIDRISIEINRRLSSDDNINIDYTHDIINGRNVSESDKNDNDSVSNNDIVDDSTSIANEEEEEEEEEEVVIEKRELRPRTNRNYAESTTTVSESGIVIVEGFSLSDYNSQVTNDVRSLHRHSNQCSSSDPDLELLETVDSSNPNMEEINIYNVKQEPVSPSAVDPLDFGIKKEVEDWTLLAPEPIDIKPDIMLLEKSIEDDDINKRGKKRKYPQFKNGIPCEPCKASFPNYVKWIRHTKSHKHQRNVAFYDINRRTTLQGSDPLNVLSSPMQADSNIVSLNSSLSAEVRQNPCPIGGCQASFKHRRNLVTHVRTHHGYRLKDLEARSQISKPNHVISSTVVSESVNNGSRVSSKNVDDEDIGDNDLVDGSGGSGKKMLFKCSHCPKEFDLRISLKSHLLIKHRIASISAKLKCDRCFKSFHRKTGLLSHMRSCGTYVKSRKCPYCLIVFPTYKETVQHKARCTKRLAPNIQQQLLNNTIGNNFNMKPNEEGTYSCDFCNITFEIQSVYYNHMEMYHAGGMDDLNSQNQVQSVQKEQQPMDEEGQPAASEQPVVGTLNEYNIPVDQDSDGKFACRYCIKTFTEVEDLQDHISYHDINKIFQCKLCYVTLNCKRYFQDHMRSHFIQHRGQYLCWTCFKPFNNRRDLTAHKTLHIKLKIYSCNVCKHSFNSILSLERHKRLHENSSLPLNSSVTKTEENSTANEEKELKDSEMNDNSTLVSNDEKDIPEFNCNVCKKSFSSESALEKHSKLHNPVKLEVIKKFVQICDNCKVVFKTTSAFRDHLQYCRIMNHGKNNDNSSNTSRYRKVQCDKCFTVFSNQMSLNKHRNLNRCPLFRTAYDVQHGTSKVYHCRYCKKSCQSIVGLYRHLKNCKMMQIKKRTAGIDSKNCIKCNKQFSSLGVLFNHEKFCHVQRVIDEPTQNTDINTGEMTSTSNTKQKCSNCSIEFHSEESLSRHMKYCKVFGGIHTEENVVTGERMFSSCSNCNRKFTTSLSYKLHKKFCNVDGDTSKPSSGAARCKGCSRVFVTRDRLRVHEKVCKLFKQLPIMMLSKPPQQLHKCTCGKFFSDSSQFATHKETCFQQTYEVSSATGSTSSISSMKSDKSKLLTCEYCFKEFNKYQAKNSHMRICQVKLRVNPKRKKYTYHTAPTATAVATVPVPAPPPPPSIPFSCVVCKGSFNTEEELIDHSCNEYSLANDLEVNNITVEPDIPQEILDMQPKPYPITNTPTISTKSPKKVAKCYPCNKIFSGSSALNKHSQLFHGQNPPLSNVIINRDGTSQCPKCPRSFRDHKSLTHHMGWHTRQGGLESVETTSSSSSSFPPPEVIISTVDDVPQQQQQHFSCPICFRKFLGKGPLQNHIKSHSNILSKIDNLDINVDLTPNIKRPKGNNYRCKICPKVFKDKISLINHHNLHKTVSPANSLRAKLLSRAGKTYVSCNICHKILSSNSIPKHNKLHKLRQDKVPTSFPPISSPVQHQQPQKVKQNVVVPPPTLLPCGFCFKLFRHQKSLNEHMIAAHSYRNSSPGMEKHPQLQTEDNNDNPTQIDDDDDDDDDDVYIVEDEQEKEMTGSSSSNVVDLEEQGEHLYKCEICDKSWKHRSVYLRHVNAPSHKEMTKRLSDILTRVNHDINDS